MENGYHSSYDTNSQRNLNHGNLNSDTEDDIVSDGHGEQKSRENEILETNNASNYGKGKDESKVIEHKNITMDPGLGGEINVAPCGDGKDIHDGAGGEGDGGVIADAVDGVTKTCLAPLAKIHGDNPGHVYYGNDDDSEDNNHEENKYYTPLKTSIPPVRINSPGEDNKYFSDSPKEDGPGTSVSGERSSEAEGEGVGTGNSAGDRDAKLITTEIDDKNRNVSSNFGDFLDEDLANIKDSQQDSEQDANSNAKQTPKNKTTDTDNNEEEPLVSNSTSTSVPVPFSQALSYRRHMQCPATLEQEGQAVEAAGEHQGGGSSSGGDESSIYLKEEGKDWVCENDDKSLSCALKTAVPTAGGVAYSGVFGVDDNDNKEETAQSQQPTTSATVSAEVSVHASQNAQSPQKSSKQHTFSDSDASSSQPCPHNINTPTSSAQSQSATKGSLQNISLSGVVPFKDSADQAFGDFNSVHFEDEDNSDDDRRDQPGKKRRCSLKSDDGGSRRLDSITVTLASGSSENIDGTRAADSVDSSRRRRKSVAESAQDWLVEWIELKGKTEWTLPLHVRRDSYRQKVLTQKTVKASGFVILKNTKRKRVQQLENWWDNVTYTLALWGKSIRRIEGVHGSGVASYFLFLRWLFGLNIVLFSFMVSFTTIPMAILDEDALEPSTDTTLNTSYYCSEAYVVEKGSGVVAALEFIQGTGWMEKTYLFYGFYVHAVQASYNLPLAYMLSVLACLVISLILMARYTGKSFREALLNAANTNFEYSNKVFGAWDYSLTDENAAEQKQKGIHDDIQGDMLEQSFMRKRIERLELRCSRCKLYSLRLVINFFILVFLGAAAYLIFFVTSWSTEYAEDNKDATGTDAWVLLLVQYLPSIAITVCNVALPLVFEKVVVLEDYSQAFVIQITLIRTVFLRLASLIVLVISLYSEISCTPKDSCNANVGSDCTELKCWETYVGQQFYKLAITDFVVVVIKVFVVELPRRFAVSKFNCGLFKALGPPEFNIPANVLDLVYGQCLVWLGFLFCPLLPGLNIAKLFIFFFVKKLSALVACPPTDRPYKASRINIFFMVILLVAFSLCALPVMYSVFAIEPSKGCGPFLLFSSMHQALEKAVDTWPSALNITYDFLTSAAVTTATIIFLAVAVYYLRSIGVAHKQQAALYREQLIMEGRDKQFLMSKIQEMYAPGQKGKQPDKDKEQQKKQQKKSSKKDRDNVDIVDERGGYHHPSNNPPPNPYSPPNAPVDNQGGDW